jgi:hypothetical protein
MMGKDERFSQMTPQQIESWVDKTVTAVSGAAVLSQASGREVARHALKNLFILTGRDQSASLQIVQKISDFAVRRRLLEVFRQSFVEASSSFTSPIFFQPGDFSNSHFADAFDRDLLNLWRHSGKDLSQFNELIKGYPNGARARIQKRLFSKEFAQKRRIRYAVNGVFARREGVSNAYISLLAMLIFLALLIIAFD